MGMGMPGGFESRNHAWWDMYEIATTSPKKWLYNLDFLNHQQYQGSQGINKNLLDKNGSVQKHRL